MSLAEDTRRRPSRTALSVGAALVVLVGAVLGYRLWWTSLDTFGGWGNGIGATIAPGTTVNIGVTEGGQRDVTLRSAEPANLVNTSDATIEVVVCLNRSPGNVLGSDSGSLDPYCSELLPLDDYAMRKHSDERPDNIIIRITPHRPGVVKMDGLILRYSQKWGPITRSGGEQVGAQMTIRTEAKS